MAYKIKLDIFEGPLDLLLHLIKENELDLYDIPIAMVTEQYLEYLDLMKNLNLEVAGEYLLMAASLTHMKSKMLLPVEEVQDDEDELDGIDPRDELIKRLVEYKKFKEAALHLREKEFDRSQIFTRIHDGSNVPAEGDLLLEVGVLELLKSFQVILDRIGEKGKQFSVTLEEISVTDRLNAIVGLLEDRDHMTFDSLFEGARGRMELIATFLALLELLRLKMIRAHQSSIGGEILIYRLADQLSENLESEFDIKETIDKEPEEDNKEE